MSHPNARLSPLGRRTLVERILIEGRPVAQVAAEMGVSRQSAYKWLGRFTAEGEAGLQDRSSRPHSSPRRTSPEVEQRVVEVRKTRAWGPQRISHALGLAASTVYAILKRHGLNCLHCLDRSTRQLIRVRYERERPGELLHLDIKKLGRIPEGGGWPFREEDPTMRGPRRRTKPGYEYLHVAIDDHTRLAYEEVLPNEQGATSAGFLRRAVEHFQREYGIRVERVLTDNGPGYHSRLFRQAVHDLRLSHKYTRPYRPQTNGKAEALIRITLREWAYKQVYRSNADRLEQLPRFLTYYNHQRLHGGIGNQPPISRLLTTSPVTTPGGLHVLRVQLEGRQQDDRLLLHPFLQLAVHLGLRRQL